MRMVQERIVRKMDDGTFALQLDECIHYLTQKEARDLGRNLLLRASK